MRGNRVPRTFLPRFAAGRLLAGNIFAWTLLAPALLGSVFLASALLAMTLFAMATAATAQQAPAANQAKEYDAEVPKTIVELQQFREAQSIPIQSQRGRAGVATLINLNPAINVWYLLKVAWKDSSSELAFPLENTWDSAPR